MAEHTYKPDVEAKKFNPKPEQPVAPPKAVDEKEELIKKIQDTLKEYHLRESEIPRSHEYWSWLNRYRGLMNP